MTKRWSKQKKGPPRVSPFTRKVAYLSPRAAQLGVYGQQPPLVIAAWRQAERARNAPSPVLHYLQHNRTAGFSL